MNLKNNVVINETIRYLSLNTTKAMIVINLVFSIVQAMMTKGSGLIEYFYFTEIIKHYFDLGLIMLFLSLLFLSFKIMNDSKKNYSFISRFKSKKEFLKNVLLINLVTNFVFIYVCYLTNFLAFNLFSSANLSIINLEIQADIPIIYVTDFIYMWFLLIRSSVILILINSLNLVLVYYFKKTYILIGNIILIYYLFNFRNESSSEIIINKIDINILDLRRYFRIPFYSDFSIELIYSLLIIVLFTGILYLSINLVKKFKSIEQ